jgi:hypothetical protein
MPEAMAFRAVLGSESHPKAIDRVPGGGQKLGVGKARASDTTGSDEGRNRCPAGGRDFRLDRIRLTSSPCPYSYFYS